MNDDFENTYKALFHKYYTNLIFYASRILNDGEDAEDVVQETFLDLWKRKETMVIGEQIQSYLYRAVYTRALNILKHRQVKEKYATLMEEINLKRAEYYQPHEQNEIIRRIESRELKHKIQNAVNGLPEKCRLVFKLSYLHNMKNKEIADATGISIRTVEAHMYKALKTLRDQLGDLTLLLVLYLLFIK